MIHETRQVPQELFEKVFLNSSSTSLNSFATKLMMHKTHGRIVQAVEESYDNRIRMYSRPQGDQELFTLS